MLIFVILLIIIAFVLIVVSKKRKKEKEREAAFKEKLQRDLEFQKACIEKLKENYGFKAGAFRRFHSKSRKHEETLIISEDTLQVAYINSTEKELHVIKGEEILEVDVSVERNETITDNSYNNNRISLSSHKSIRDVRVGFSTSGSKPFISFLVYFEGTEILQYSGEKAADVIRNADEIKACLIRLRKNTLQTQTTNTSLSLSNELISLKKLHEDGIISEADFEKAKQKLLA